MKICIICPHFPTMGYPCGAADFVDNLSSRLSEFEKVSVVTSNQNSIIKDSVEIKIFSGSWNLFKVMKIAKWIKENNFDVVDVQYESYMYAYKGYILLLPLFLPKKVKKILTLHSEGLPKFGKKFWRVAQYTLFQEVIFYSEHFLKNALNRFGSLKNKFHLAPFPSNITRIEQTPLKKILRQSFKGYDPSLLYISYFGHLTAERGLEEMIQAVKDVSSDKVHLILIGQFTPEKNPYHRELSALIRRLGIENQITFTERLDEKDVSSIIQISDVGLLPFVEGVSFKNGSLAAYIAHQIPVVTSKSELTEDLLLQNKGIQFFNYKNPKEMKNIIETILENPKTLENMQREIGKLSDHYSWNNYIKNRIACYQK
ncbi:MAG: glycosyltransferase [Bacteriovorax sp.]|nr:glycosyltransferase [Bacteriovorax sp.]